MYLKNYKVLLLDMNSTFMFGEDRFGQDQDYAATYRDVGGDVLTHNQVKDSIQLCYEELEKRYDDPGYVDSFPQVGDVLFSILKKLGIDHQHLSDLESVFAVHELGHIPQAYATLLQQLAKKYELGLVSNIWSQKAPWLKVLEEANVMHVFKTMVFSSDGMSMKPSPVLYEKAIEAFSVERKEIVFIGDSLKYDVEGAKRVGLDTIWIQGQQEESSLPDYTIRDLLSLQV